MNRYKSDFKHWDDKITIDRLASLWMAYSEDPSLSKVQKANIFGSNSNDSYRKIFNIDEIDKDYVKEMILAFNLFELIGKQTELYGIKKVDGQILTKVDELFKDTVKDTDIDSNALANISNIISRSYIFSDIFKSKFETQNSAFEYKNIIKEILKKYAFFSRSRYHVLAIFRLIIIKCGYKQMLIEDGTNFFEHKEFLDKNLVQKWLRIVVDDIIKGEYSKFKEDVGASDKVFYNRPTTWNQIQSSFEYLEFKKEQEFKHIFPLNPFD